MTIGSQLTEFDKKILHELEKDGRMSLTKIAAKIGRSKSFVGRRLVQLQEGGVYRGIRMTIDTSKLGFHRYRLYLQVIDHHAATSNDLLLWLKNQPAIFAVERIVGKYQLYLSLSTKASRDVELLIRSIARKFERIVGEYKLLLVYACHSKPHRFLGVAGLDLHHNLLTSGEIVVSPQEMQLIEVMSTHPTIAYSTLAKELGCTATTAKRMFQRLVKQGVIVFIRPWLDIRKAGYFQKHLMIKLKFSGLNRIDEIKTYLLQCAPTKSLHYSFGMYDLLGRFTFSSVDEFHEFQAELYKKFSDALHFINYHDYHTPLKYSHVPVARGSIS